MNVKYQIEVQAKIIEHKIKEYEEKKSGWKENDKKRRKTLSQEIAKQAYDHYQATEEYR